MNTDCTQTQVVGLPLKQGLILLFSLSTVVALCVLGIDAAYQYPINQVIKEFEKGETVVCYELNTKPAVLVNNKKYTLHTGKKYFLDLQNNTSFKIENCQ